MRFTSSFVSGPGISGDGRGGSACPGDLSISATLAKVHKKTPANLKNSSSSLPHFFAVFFPFSRGPLARAMLGQSHYVQTVSVTTSPSMNTGHETASGPSGEADKRQVRYRAKPKFCG